MTRNLLKAPVRIGLVGTGYAAKRRAEALNTHPQAQLLFVSGNSPEKTASFCQTYGVSSLPSWQELISHPELDLIIVATINRDHGEITQAALEAGKHVVVEYPLALNPKQAQDLISLATQQNKLLHIEHIELLGGLHQAIRRYLPHIGEVFSARYSTISPQRPVERRWNYHQEMFGFPLSAALSRIHRLTDLFGKVASVTCQCRYWNASEDGYFSACFSSAKLVFANGLIADLTYAKGDVCWKSDRTFELHGDKGTLFFEREQGWLIRNGEKTPIEVGSRRGLFAQDTNFVLAHLLEGIPLYLEPAQSLYSLKVADAASHSSQTGMTIYLEEES